MDDFDTLEKEEFCIKLTDTYINNERVLKLMSILYSVLEKNCSLEKLIDFKKSLVGFTAPIVECVKKYFPDSNDEDILTFIATTSNYIQGLYPATHLTQKQEEAIKLSGFDGFVEHFRESCIRGFIIIASVLK